MKRALSILLVGAALAGCTDGHGRVDYGRTALLGLGVGAATIGTAAIVDRPHRRHRYGGGYYRDGYLGRAPGNYGSCSYYGGCW